MASNVSSDMDVLVIGAARPPAPNNEQEFRMWDGVFADIQTIYGFCRDPAFDKSDPNTKRSQVNIFQTLANWKIDLRPDLSPPSNIQSAIDRKEVPPSEQYLHKQDVRDRVCRFIEEAPSQNMMIYFSGHGLYQQSSAADLLSQALCLPAGGSVTSSLEYYNASELTKDINDCLLRRRSEPPEDGPEKLTVYLVIDACHAEGAVNFWEIVKQVRMDENTSIVLFAGAEARLETKYDSRGGVFTQSFCRRAAEMKGRRVSDIAQGILIDILGEKTSPCVRYSRPSLCDKVFL